MARVLVTGGSGFIAGHVILRLLAAGHSVRATVRSLSGRSAGREQAVRSRLSAAGAPAGGSLEFAAADLAADAGWPEAARGCEFVLHVASPLPLAAPRDPGEVIGPARAGTLRVLRAARHAGARRMVLTSSFAAIGYGHPPMGRSFDESDWTDISAPRLGAYVLSKTLAERDAWEFIAREGGGLELAAVNPVAVFGPVLGSAPGPARSPAPNHGPNPATDPASVPAHAMIPVPTSGPTHRLSQGAAPASDLSASLAMLRKLLRGGVPGCPRLWYGAVDVRDTADLHLLAMTHPAAAGERFLCAAGDFLSVREMALILKSGMGEAARRVPTRSLPDWSVRLLGLFDRKVREALPELGKRRNATAAKARNLLGWNPRSPAEALLAAGESLRDLGFLA